MQSEFIILQEYRTDILITEGGGILAVFMPRNNPFPLSSNWKRIPSRGKLCGVHGESGGGGGVGF